MEENHVKKCLHLDNDPDHRQNLITCCQSHNQPLQKKIVKIRR